MPLRDLLAGPAPRAAKGLLGCELVHGDVVLRIVEVEAYGGPRDSASHARHGHTARNGAMWGPPGGAYLYFCYGMHWMLNVVTGEAEVPSAVLIRGAEVVAGQALVMERRRVARPSAALCAGPGKVAQALGLDRTFDGHDLLAPGGLQLLGATPTERILAGPRVGIAFATPADQRRPWRFALAGSPAVSRPKVGS